MGKSKSTKAKKLVSPQQMPEKILDISQGIDSLLNLKQRRTLDKLRNQVAECCLQACDCCLQVS
jgi:hypothetical protein